jgi:hypothetical protein
MILRISKRTKRVYFVAHNADWSVHLDGEVQPGQVLASGQPLLDWSEDPGVLLDLCPAHAYPDLPPVGKRMREGKRYRDRGAVVQVRRRHVRTRQSPNRARFLMPAPAGTVIDWEPDERVYRRDERVHLGTLYICREKHLTTGARAPDRAPRFWVAA